MSSNLEDQCGEANAEASQTVSEVQSGQDKKRQSLDDMEALYKRVTQLQNDKDMLTKGLKAFEEKREV